MSDVNHNFWMNHSEEFLEMATDGSFNERLFKPDGYGKNLGDCGDTVEIFLHVKEGLIIDAAFDIDGCVNTYACANTVANKVRGITLEEAWDLTPETVIDYLKTLPEANHHCAELAVGALYLALSDVEKKNSSAL